MKNKETIVDLTFDLTAIFKLLAFLPIAYEMARIYHGFFGEILRSLAFESYFYAPYVLLGVFQVFGKN